MIGASRLAIKACTICERSVSVCLSALLRILSASVLIINRFLHFIFTTKCKQQFQPVKNTSSTQLPTLSRFLILHKTTLSFPRASPKNLAES
jgi:hypothetical protein